MCDILHKAHLVVSPYGQKQCAHFVGKAKPKSVMGNMATYHCSIRVGKKGKACPHASYISRTGEYSSGEKYEDLEATEFGNMPYWIDGNPNFFWSCSDEYERQNGSTYREIEVALPNELNQKERLALVHDFVSKIVKDKHAYQWAIHCPKSAISGVPQPHLHLMYSERIQDEFVREPDQFFKRYNNKYPDRGGCQKDSAGTKERLQETRELWASIQNKHLEMNGHDSRVDHRTLEAQGLDRIPESHLGWRAIKILSPDEKNDLVAYRSANIDLIETDQAVVSLMPDLKSEIQTIKQVLALEEVDRLIAQRQEKSNLDGLRQEWRTIRAGETIVGPVKEIQTIHDEQYLVISAGPNMDRSAQQYVLVKDPSPLLIGQKFYATEKDGSFLYKPNMLKSLCSKGFSR